MAEQQESKDDRKEVKATQSWDQFRNFASNLMQVTPEDVKEVEAKNQEEDKAQEED